MSPVQNVGGNTGSQILFSMYSHAWTHGVTGVVSYQLPDNSLLVIQYNVPETQNGSGSTKNVFYYAFIQNPSDADKYIPPLYYVDYISADQLMNTDPPVIANSVTITIYLKEYTPQT